MLRLYLADQRRGGPLWYVRDQSAAVSQYSAEIAFLGRSVFRTNEMK